MHIIQEPALVLSLEDEALDAVLEIDESDISKENGVDFIIDRLNCLFKKDLTVTKYQTWRLSRPSSMSIQAYLNESNKRLFKTKYYGTVMSDHILAYRLLKSANLSSYNEELVKATIPDSQYNIKKYHLKKTFSDASKQTTTKSEGIKTEEAFIAKETNHLSFQGSYNQNVLHLENQYNPFKDIPNHLSTDQDHSTRDNYRN